jgi:hypothetical protein
VSSVIAPSFTVSVGCSLTLGICDAEFGLTQGSFSTKLDFTYDDKELGQQVISTGLRAPRSSLVLLGASLEYRISKDGNVKRNIIKEYMPAGIVEAILV